jgi:hypothetical protein
MTVYWLVLFFNFTSTEMPSPLHVGTFASMESCKAAAQGAVGIDTNPGGKISGLTFICVQANEPGAHPPE